MGKCDSLAGVRLCVRERAAAVIRAFSGNTFFLHKVYLMCLEADVIKASFT